MGKRGTGPANAFSQAVNDEIRALAARRNMNQTELAEAVGVGQSTISKIIYKNEAPLNTNLLEQLANALGDLPSEILRRAETALKLSDDPRTVANVETDLYLAAKSRTAREQDVNEEDYF